MSEFIKYLKENKHSPSCTRAEAFAMGQRSKQAKIDRVVNKIDSFFDGQVATPTQRDYANFLVEIQELLK